MLTALADIEALGVAPRQGQHLVRHQPVVDHDVGLLQQAMSLERQQVGIARPRADKMDDAGRFRRWSPRAIEQPYELAPGGNLVARQRQLADPPLQHAIPEAATLGRIAHRAPHLVAEDLGEARHPADGGR